jgi:hypothetical protein
MKKILPVFFCVCFCLANTPIVFSQSSIDSSDLRLFNFIKTNVSPVTGLPYSFYISQKDKSLAYHRMGSPGVLEGIIERTIVHEGFDIYDGAIYQIVLSMAGGQENLNQALRLDRYYWQGAVGANWNIRAGYPICRYIYDPKNPRCVSSDLKRVGERGFIFRILDADGNYLVTDPLDGKKFLAGYPNSNRLHWEDWKPVAGENAWVVIAALQIYHKKYFDETRGAYDQHPDSVELKLSREIARAAMILQSETGGIRMSPLGAHRNLEDEELGSFTEHDWWYNHISTENNLSWYAAFRMLYHITGEAQYKTAMDGIQRYLQFVWDAKRGFLYQGAYFAGGRWRLANDYSDILKKKLTSIRSIKGTILDPSNKEGVWQETSSSQVRLKADADLKEAGIRKIAGKDSEKMLAILKRSYYFAEDVQNWSIACIGPKNLDTWFGEGTAWRIWQSGRRRSGVFDKDGRLLGIGYTDEHDRISVEWSGGAMTALTELADYYKNKNPRRALLALDDKYSMRRSMENLRRDISSTRAAYGYSSRRAYINFGWFSHDPQVLSLTSTGWMILVDAGFNPFWISQAH